VEVDQFDGVTTSTVKYVADGTVLLPDEVINPFLVYPQSCGCTDPAYVEYSPNYACNIQDSCHTLVVFGCLDTLACNYDPSANFNVQELCCYPGFCNDRDLELVCPGLSSERISIKGIFPVPVKDVLNVRLQSVSNMDLNVTIADASGRIVYRENTGRHEGMLNFSKNISSLSSGIYLLMISSGDQLVSQTFVIE
jgi:hypothetical protein